MDTAPLLYAGHPVYLAVLPPPPAQSLTSALVAAPTRTSPGGPTTLTWRSAASLAADPSADVALQLVPASRRAARGGGSLASPSPLRAGDLVELRAGAGAGVVVVVAPAAGATVAAPQRVFRLAAADANEEAGSPLAALLPPAPPPPTLALGNGLRLLALSPDGGAVTWPAGGGAAAIGPTASGAAATIFVALPAARRSAPDFNPFASLLSWVSVDGGATGCDPAGRDAWARRLQLEPAGPRGAFTGHPTALATFGAWYDGCMAASRAAFRPPAAGCPGPPPPPPDSSPAAAAALFDACHWDEAAMRHGCEVVDGAACAAAAAAVNSGRAVAVPGALDVDAALETERAALEGGGGGTSSVAEWSGGGGPSLIARISDAIRRVLPGQSER